MIIAPLPGSGTGRMGAGEFTASERMAVAFGPISRAEGLVDGEDDLGAGVDVYGPGVEW